MTRGTRSGTVVRAVPRRVVRAGPADPAAEAADVAALVVALAAAAVERAVAGATISRWVHSFRTSSTLWLAAFLSGP